MTRSEYHHRYIHREGNKYYIKKWLNGKQHLYQRSFKEITDAMEYRDTLIKNDWVEPELTPEEVLKKETKQYYHHIQRNDTRTGYRVRHKTKIHSYLPVTRTIEEALYYRDLYYDCPRETIPLPTEIDLKTDNPYLIDGLRYPLPENMVLKKPKILKGSITHSSRNSYKVSCRGESYGRYPTYEMAYYVHKEMRNVDWDMSKLQGIVDEYPRWYTKLLFFYEFIVENKQASKTGRDKWKVDVPTKYREKPTRPILYSYARLEDALHERDWLMENNWDYCLMVELIDDLNNPYEEMELPPFPQRKVRALRRYKTHTEEINNVADLIKEGVMFKKDVCRITGYSPVNMRNWLHRYNLHFREFVQLVQEYPEEYWEHMEMEEQIVQPDLSKDNRGRKKKKVSL